MLFFVSVLLLLLYPSCKEVLNCVFRFYFSYDEWHWVPFYVLLVIYISSLKKMSIHFLCPFLNYVVLLSLKNFLYILGINIYKINDLQIFSPILWTAFSPCWYCLLMHNIYKLSWTPVCLLLLLLPLFGVLSKKASSNPMAWNSCPVCCKSFIINSSSI